MTWRSIVVLGKLFAVMLLAGLLRYTATEIQAREDNPTFFQDLSKSLKDFDKQVNTSIFIGGLKGEDKNIYIAPGDEIKGNLRRLYSQQYRIVPNGFDNRVKVIISQGKSEYLTKVFLDFPDDTPLSRLLEITYEYENAVTSQYPNRVTFVWYRFLGQRK